jgi:hypothetical protein
VRRFRGGYLRFHSEFICLYFDNHSHFK